MRCLQTFARVNLLTMSEPHTGHITWRELLARTGERIAEPNVARWLCEHASGCDSTEFAGIQNELVNARSGQYLNSMVERYEAGEPLQYVMGRWAFRHLDLLVDNRVLIPRPETELLVEHVLNFVRNQEGPFVMADLGTGSGALGLSLLSELPLGEVTMWLTDSSTDALDVARANAAGLGRPATGARFAHGSWFDALQPSLKGSLDVVVSNPPYIADNDPEVHASVREWEPASALFSGHDGLDDLRIIVNNAPHWLRSGGLLGVEMGYTQTDAVMQLFVDAGFTYVHVHPDLAGKPRFVTGIL